MTTLLVDIGNTRVKWARLVDGRMGKQHAAASEGWGARQYARRVIGRGWAGREGRIVVSSVAGKQTNQLLVAAARQAIVRAYRSISSEASGRGISTNHLT